jgi:ribosomal protein S27AE
MKDDPASPTKDSEAVPGAFLRQGRAAQRLTYEDKDLSVNAVKARQCPTCGGILVFSHEDDVYTKFYKCQKCGTMHSLRTTREELATLIRQVKEARHNVEDKPKGVKPKCGGCAAFRTPFCSFTYKDYDAETMKALAVDAEAYTCSRYFPRPHVETEGEKKFLKKVEQLE